MEHPSTTIERTGVAIIGAGFAGLAAAIRLLEAGRRDFLIFERADEIGGTWRDNVYPGCACDIPSHLYSYSFAQNPNWTRMFPPQQEILDYLKDCVARYGLQDHIRYGHEARKYVFDEEKGEWEIGFASGARLCAPVLISATGPLNRPHIPDFTGRESFEGLAFHSSQWPQEVDLRGKRVAVIGTGASAIQIVPAIAPEVSQLYLFQRSAPWIVPKPDRNLLAAERWLYRHFPPLQQLFRNFIYWSLEIRYLGFKGNKTMARLAEKTALKHLEKQVKDPALRKALTPNYQIGCKRILPSDAFYPALQRPNVELVTTPIAGIAPTGILDASGRLREAEVIIFATGFNAAEMDKRVQIVGRNGRNLHQEWAQSGPEAYLGTTVSGYPNLFIMIGPNTGLGHNSMIHIMESQLNYIMDALHQLEARQASFLDVKPQVQQAYNHEIQQKLNSTVWQTGGCTSWYQLESGKNTTLFPGFTRSYRKLTRHLRPEDYEWHKVDEREGMPITDPNEVSVS
ncbi:MAG: NAD(P)/FAD-dependent oxidoreductase [Bacteroidetes bacterium]|nr:MAG: NAD(P)/FAD-dependent oxidoreductase [Bacteroidota bacterium]